MDKAKFLILGHEARQVYLKEMLEAKGHDVTMAEDYVEGDYDAFLLPIPLSAQYFKCIQDKLKIGQYVFGCNIPFPAKNIVCAMTTATRIGQVRIVEYMKSDSVAYKNAIATAEGAIAEAIRASAINLHGSHSLVTGYGRCGEILAYKLKAMNSDVTVMDRSSEKRAKAYAYGFDTMKFDSEQLKINGKQFQFLFNTVPEKVIDAAILENLPKTVTIIDIASKPGGTDFDYCKEHGLYASLEAGLPGRYAPKTSAEILLDVIEENMNNSEVS
jgi:dipicolinate synthase subunit A